MDNRVYYGQYSLKHWLDLILKKNITLPDYQRYFVWDENKVKTLIDTFKKKQFVPPITIGAFKGSDGINENLILDGQQRLTSILLAYLDLYPDPFTFRSAVVRLANDNDDEDEEDEELMDNILEWDFKRLTEKGKNKKEILGKIVEGNYKKVNFNVNEDFLKQTFLGFSYLVPNTDDERKQQKYYSSVFRNINIQGERLLPQESRASLYFLNKDLAQFFDPDFAKQIILKNYGNLTKIDFVRFLALLSQYAKDGNISRIARGYKPKMEKYYEEYIYSVVGENSSHMFKEFSTIFPDGKYLLRFEKLKGYITSLRIQTQFTSVIDMDVYLMGLIYTVVFKNKAIKVERSAELRDVLQAKIEKFKQNYNHRKSPGALKYLKERIDVSIKIYNLFTNG